MLAGTRSWPSDCDLRLPDTECPGEGPFYWHCLTWIPVWIGNHMPSKVWDGFTYPFPTLPSSTVEVWEWINTVVNTGLVNGVLPGGTKPSLVPMLCKGRLPFVPVVRDFCHAIQPEWIFLRLVVPVARPSKTTTLGYRAAHGVQLLYFARLWLVVTLFKDGHLVKDVENL